MSKLANQANIQVLTNIFVNEDGTFVEATVKSISKEISVIRYGKDIEEAEDLAITRAEELFFSEDFPERTSLRFRGKKVVLSPEKKSPTTGTKVPAVFTQEITVDLITKDSEGEVLRQAVITRQNEDLVEAEKQALERAMSLIGVGK